MAKPVALSDADLTATKNRPGAATRQRGEVPSTELVPLQFKISPDFKRDFRIEAAKRGMKLNEFLKYCFQESMKTSPE